MVFRLSLRCVAAALFVFGSAGLAAAAPAPSPSPSASASPAAEKAEGEKSSEKSSENAGEHGPESEIGRVVTSDRREEPIGSSSRPTFVIDRSQIEARGARTIADALAQVPGMTVFPYGGAFGSQADYGIRGSTSAETLILVDGAPAATGSSGTIDLGAFATTGVERIEVVESGASTLYGSSAVGGVINIITGGAPTALARASVGSLGETDFAADTHAGGLYVAVEHHTANNVYAYPMLAYTPNPPQAAGVRTNDDAEQSVFRFAYKHEFAGFGLDFSGGADQIRIGVPGSASFLTPNARQNVDGNDAVLSLEHDAGPGTVTLSFSGSTQRLAYADPDNGGESDTYDGRAQASLKYSVATDHYDVVAGADVARESAFLALGPSGPPPNFGASEAQSALYAQLGFRVAPTARLIAGARAENDSPLGRTIAPSIGTVIGLGAAKFSANLGQAFRVPTLIDLYYPGYSNPNLQPEKLGVYDATLALPLAGGVTIGYFGRNGSNLIALNPTTFAPFNAARASVNGFQVTAATKPRNHLRFTASATDLYKSLDTSTGLRLPRSPVIGGTFGAERAFDDDRFAYGVNVNVVGSSPGNAPSGSLTEDSATLANVYLRYKVTRNAIASFRVRNLGDIRYAPVYGYPSPGRTIMFELSTR